MTSPIRVLVTDDQAIVRKGLCALLSTESDIEVVGEAQNGREAVDMANRLRPDVVLMDLVMPEMDGIQAIQRITDDQPEARILVLTSFAADDKIFPAIKAGALGYLLKDTGPNELVDAIRQVHRGEPSLHPSIARRVFQEIAHPPAAESTVEPLTARALEVLTLVADGKSRDEIAAELAISNAAVLADVGAILDKLHLAGRTQAALFALGEELASLDGGAEVRAKGKVVPSRMVPPAAGCAVPKAHDEEALREDALALVAGWTEIDLSRFSVVGAYLRYDERVRHTLKDARQQIASAFKRTGRARENYLIWAYPGTGKTHFVRETAASLPGVRYVEANLAACVEAEFIDRLAEVREGEGPSLCLVDEIDARNHEDWPYERLLEHLDASVEQGKRCVFVMTGSSGSGLSAMKDGIASRTKGSDMLSRVPKGNEVVIPALDVGDRVLVALIHFRQAAKDVARDVASVEKLALYYVALSPTLANARQLREFAVRCVDRLPAGENRLRYDHLFNPGDPENKTFWADALPFSEILVGRFVVFND